ncbi:MAG: FAD-dependent oxidoreductase [Candidatus Melainabacteria bacterium]|nr:FAD-dependent oxidoreductase [Candidatus Melainabacteria bacterium]
MRTEYDLIAVGAGPAAESATELAAFFGHRSLIIEKNKPGGTVTTTGGVPTKTLREVALYVTGYRDREVYGVQLEAPPDLVLSSIQHRTLSVCDTLQRVTADNIASRGVDYVQGTAQLVDNHTVMVVSPDGQQKSYTAKNILIATGSRPRRPDGMPFNLPGVCDTDTVLLRGWLPKEILIVGGGPVAVEFATVCHALGARVTMLDRGSRLLPAMDAEISERLSTLFEKFGVNIEFGTTLNAIEENGGTLKASISNGKTMHPDTILFAAGRVANSENLGLEETGIKTDERGRIVVDKMFRTSADNVYAAGDVLGPTLASVAMEQGRIAVCHAFGIPFEGVVDPTPVSAVYGMPELAGAGLTEEECRKQNIDYEVGRCDLSLTPRGAIAGRGGLLKLLFRKDDRKLIGVHCLGDIASEIVGIGQMAIRCGGTVNTIANMSMNTPTYSYAYKYAAFDGLRRLAKGKAVGVGENSKAPTT